MYKAYLHSFSIKDSDLWDFKSNDRKGDMIDFAKVAMSKKFKNKSSKRKKKK